MRHKIFSVYHQRPTNENARFPAGIFFSRKLITPLDFLAEGAGLTCPFKKKGRFTFIPSWMTVKKVFSEGLQANLAHVRAHAICHPSGSICPNHHDLDLVPHLHIRQAGFVSHSPVGGGFRCACFCRRGRIRGRDRSRCGRGLPTTASDKKDQRDQYDFHHNLLYGGFPRRYFYY